MTMEERGKGMTGISKGDKGRMTGATQTEDAVGAAAMSSESRE